MLKKNRVKKLNPEQIINIVNKDTIPQNIILCQQTLRDKNSTLQEKKQVLIEDMIHNRITIEKIVKQLADSMKQKLRLNQKVILDKSSRPTAEEMKNLSKIYAIVQKQRLLNEEKDKYITSISQDFQQKLDSQQLSISKNADYSGLDKQFQKLQKQCEAQIIIRDEMIRERDRLRNHYLSIEGQIEECRKVYETVQDNIRTAQRQLIQLSSYLKERENQDKEHLAALRKEASDLEGQLLKGQQIINANSYRRDSLQMHYAEVCDRQLY